ncbi:PREDICTED: uncharacterized protein LOC101293858 isoform X2 [Fragaria vesca subsp. vesca]|uniref:uncharacterized protein LOC101293858 isoform X2 n=1 Tax=Fragaria vesca subsp. vesca TaxID=101020 RepID=UPI0002C378D5|nr:PREDICTED: uncharacterized protein LOC101293858 isoform X2 [Fragaria vesca subsp. vesca]
MASSLNPTYAYTVVYVKDVAKSIAFYSKAFGYAVRRIDESHSGQTTIAFTPKHQHETDDLTGKVQKPSSGEERQPVEVCFDYPDVAYKRAVENGAVAVSAPEQKEWGQKVGYVPKQVRMGSYVNEPKQG